MRIVTLFTQYAIYTRHTKIRFDCCQVSTLLTLWARDISTSEHLLQTHYTTHQGSQELQCVQHYNACTHTQYCMDPPSAEKWSQRRSSPSTKWSWHCGLDCTTDFNERALFICTDVSCSHVSKVNTWSIWLLQSNLIFVCLHVYCILSE